MSNFRGFGTISGNTSTDWVSVRGWTTLSAHIDSGTGTMTWKFKSIDGVERTIYGGADGTTAQAFTASHMVNIYFGDDVTVRGTVSGHSGITLDWQILGSPVNR